MKPSDLDLNLESFQIPHLEVIFRDIFLLLPGKFPGEVPPKTVGELAKKSGLSAEVVLAQLVECEKFSRGWCCDQEQRFEQSLDLEQMDFDFTEWLRSVKPSDRIRVKGALASSVFSAVMYLRRHGYGLAFGSC